MEFDNKLGWHRRLLDQYQPQHQLGSILEHMQEVPALFGAEGLAWHLASGW